MSGDRAQEERGSGRGVEQDDAKTGGDQEQLRAMQMQRRASERKGGGGAVDLGMLEKPGAKLGGSTHELAPGATLRFEFGENQIWGINKLTVDPPHAATVEDQLLEKYTDHVLGSMSKHAMTIKISEKAKSGEKIKFTTNPNYQSRDSPDWAFSFSVHVK